MHPCILREFHLSLSPSPAPAADGASEIIVRMRHGRTAQDAVFCLRNDSAANPARAVEDHVMRYFPSSDAAAELRVLYGTTRHRLKAQWASGLGDRLYFQLSNARRSKGARFWAELIPTLPTLLYSTMTSRAVDYLGRLGPEVELRTIIKSVYDAWFTVLKEVRNIPGHPTGPERLALDLHGWPTELMLHSTLLDYSRMREKALFALMALDYLSEEDWADMASILLEPAAATAALTLQPEQ